MKVGALSTPTSGGTLPVVPSAQAAQSAKVKAELEDLSYDQRCEVIAILDELKNAGEKQAAQKKLAHARWIQLKIARRMGAFNTIKDKKKTEAPAVSSSTKAVIAPSIPSLASSSVQKTVDSDTPTATYDAVLYAQALRAHDQRQGWARLLPETQLASPAKETAGDSKEAAGKGEDKLAVPVEEQGPEAFKGLRERLKGWLALPASPPKEKAEQEKVAQRIARVRAFCATSNRVDECLAHLDHETQLARQVLAGFKSKGLKEDKVYRAIVKCCVWDKDQAALTVSC